MAEAIEGEYDYIIVGAGFGRLPARQSACRPIPPSAC